MLDTIKEYLVGLGFSVDKNSMGQAQNAMNGFEKGIKQFASKAAVAFGKAGLAVAGFVTAGVVGISKFMDSLGNQEIQMEMLSRTLWTTQQNAYAFSLTLKALGANLQELYLSPTLMKQYRELNSLALGMTPPTGYQQEIGTIQNISLEFKKMKLEASYAMQWIGYYFIKFMQGPLESVQNVLERINNIIVKKMPEWTKTVAKWMASFAQGAIYIYDALQKVYTWFKDFLSYIPTWTKLVVVGFAGLGLALEMGPFGIFVTALSAALLLLDDFYTYLHGGKSALGPFWANLTQTFHSLFGGIGKNNPVASLTNDFKSLQTTLKSIGNWFNNLTQTLNKNGTFSSVLKSLKDLLTSIDDLLNAMSSSKNKSTMQGFGDLMTNIIGDTMKTMAGAIEEVAGFIQMASDALSGNWNGAKNVLQNMWTGQNLANIGVISQNWVAGGNGPAVGPKSYPYMFQSAGSPTSNSSKTINAPVNSTTNVHIHGNADAKKVAQHSQNGFQTTWNIFMQDMKNLF